MTRQAIGFILVGLVAGAVNVFVRVILSTTLSYSVAVALAFPCGLIVAYVLNREFVFMGTASASNSEFIRFAGVNVVALAQVWLVSVTLAEYIFPALNFPLARRNARPPDWRRLSYSDQLLCLQVFCF